MNTSSFFSYDYRDVGGILFPHQNARVMYSADPSHMMVVEEVKMNQDLGEDFFTKYKAKPIQE